MNSVEKSPSGKLVRSLHRVVFGVSAFLVWGTPLVSPVVRAQSATPTFHINSQRLQGTLEKLSEFGRNPEGGVTRLGFSETDLAARTYITGLMRQAGLEVRIDPAGNIFGLRAGSEKLPILLFGSHIDSVLHGGNFDGDVGSMGAIEVMRASERWRREDSAPFGSSHLDERRGQPFRDRDVGFGSCGWIARN